MFEKKHAFESLTLKYWCKNQMHKFWDVGKIFNKYLHAMRVFANYNSNYSIDKK